MRAAAAHAGPGDVASLHAELDAADRAYERGSAMADPIWVRFVTPAELEGLHGDSLIVLGEHEQAADAFRSMAQNLDERFSRNRAYYSVKLASSLLLQGDIAEASSQALAVLPEVISLDSYRVRASLDEVCTAVAPHQAQVPAAQELVHAYAQAQTA
jgi:hypothetical protein